MPLKITTSAETTIRPWPNIRQRHSIVWRPRQRHVLRRLLPTNIVTSKRQKSQNKLSTDSAWTFRLTSWSMQWHPWPTSHSLAKSKLFAPTDLRVVHTESRLNFKVIRCLCFRLCRVTVDVLKLCRCRTNSPAHFWIHAGQITWVSADATSNQATRLVQDEANR